MMCKCDICTCGCPDGSCIKQKRGEECDFKPDGYRVIKYAETRHITIIEAIELWKLHLSYYEK